MRMLISPCSRPDYQIIILDFALQIDRGRVILSGNNIKFQILIENDLIVLPSYHFFNQYILGSILYEKVLLQYVAVCCILMRRMRIKLLY